MLLFFHGKHREMSLNMVTCRNSIGGAQSNTQEVPGFIGSKVSTVRVYDARWLHLEFVYTSVLYKLDTENSFVGET